MFANYPRLRHHPKWGFIIYRCDYRDDSTWSHFIDRWSQLVNTWLIQNRQGGLIENLEWTIREDRAALDKATVEDVRELFTVWTKTKEAVIEQQAVTDLQILASPRYSFCIHVDAKALDDCLAFDSLPEDKQLKFWHRSRDPALGHAPYVNIVEKVVEMIETPQYEEDEEDDDEVISLKVHWQSVVPDVYYKLLQAPDAFQSIARDVDQDGVHL